MLKKIKQWFLIIILLVIVGCAKEEKQSNISTPTNVSQEANFIFQKEKVEIKTTKESTALISTKDIKTLEEALKAGVPVIVKLGSDRCYPCRMMKPIIEELSVEQNGKAVFLDLDVYENRDLASQFFVRVIPTIIFYDKRGIPKAKVEGFMSKEELLRAIEELELNK